MPITDLISTECPLRSLETDAPKPACCEVVRVKESDEAEESDENTQQDGMKPHQEEHRWLDPQLIENLPVNIKKGKEDRTFRTVIQTKETILYH